MNPRIARIGIAINWSRLRDLMKEHLDERGGDEQLLRSIALSDFLIWLHGRQRVGRTKETGDDESKSGD